MTPRLMVLGGLILAAAGVILYAVARLAAMGDTERESRRLSRQRQSGQH